MLIELLIKVVLVLAAIFIAVSPGVLLFLIIRYLYIRQKEKYEKPQKYYQKYMDPGPYETGWTWNENTKLWEPPATPEKIIKINRSEPTFEEWRQSKANESKPSTYRMVGSEIPKDDTIVYSKATEVKPKHKAKSKPVQKPSPNERTAEFQNAYQAANILTANERTNYKNLKIAADRKGYIICPKVRLADIITPRHDSQYMSRFGKIKAKHVDFVVYDEDMRHIKAVIELDDSSHDRKDRQERDEFVDFILNDCGIRIIHTRYITPDILDGI